MGIITDAANRYLKVADDLADRGLTEGAKLLGYGDNARKAVEKFKQETNRSWVYPNQDVWTDDISSGNVLSGEAKPLHPFQFLDETALPLVGVTRMPLTAMNAAKLAVKTGKYLKGAKIPQKIGTWQPKSTTTNLRKRLSAGVAGAGATASLLTKTGKTVGKDLKQELKIIAKNPKKVGTLAGSAIAAMTQSGTQTQRETGNMDETGWIRPRRVNRSRWI